jgi:hypothetical protein
VREVEDSVLIATTETYVLPFDAVDTRRRSAEFPTN